MTIAEASRLFRAMRGDPEACRTTLYSELMVIEFADTFAEFIRVNDLALYEEVVR